MNEFLRSLDEHASGEATQILQDCQRWLRENGYAPSFLADTLLRFKYHGYNVLIENDNKDAEYLAIRIVFGSVNFSSATEIQKLRVAGRVTQGRKVVKVYVDADGNVVFAAEILLDQTPQVEDLLRRLLVMLRQAVDEYVKELEEL